MKLEQRYNSMHTVCNIKLNKNNKRLDNFEKLTKLNNFMSQFIKFDIFIK